MRGTGISCGSSEPNDRYNAYSHRLVPNRSTAAGRGDEIGPDALQRPREHGGVPRPAGDDERALEPHDGIFRQPARLGPRYSRVYQSAGHRVDPLLEEPAQPRVEARPTGAEHEVADHTRFAPAVVVGVDRLDHLLEATARRPRIAKRLEDERSQRLLELVEHCAHHVVLSFGEVMVEARAPEPRGL